MIAQAERRTKVQLSLDFIDLILSSFFRPGEGYGGHMVSRKPPCGLPLPLKEHRAPNPCGRPTGRDDFDFGGADPLGRRIVAPELTRPIKNFCPVGFELRNGGARTAFSPPVQGVRCPQTEIILPLLLPSSPSGDGLAHREPASRSIVLLKVR